jgi:hypothetical protein
VAVAIQVVVLWRLSALAKLTMALLDASHAVIRLKGGPVSEAFYESEPALNLSQKVIPDPFEWAW